MTPSSPPSRFRLMFALLLTIVMCSLLGTQLSPRPPVLSAAVYSGGGVEEGISQAGGISGVESGEPREIIGNIVNKLLGYVALIAVVTIIIAGLYLILGFGSDTSKNTAKNIVLYTAIGLLIILLSKAIVQFFIDLASGG
ncbi:MAG: hypothetical protein PHS73_02915 [Candidatus Peribacteraceae bacterium]|nr:hypothetical protein [Candidatus Peribacteraceae bacterium]